VDTPIGCLSNTLSNAGFRSLPSDVAYWPDSAVAGIRLERQLSEDELPTRQLSTTGGHPR
jgi:hypothetical protein